MVCGKGDCARQITICAHPKSDITIAGCIGASPRVPKRTVLTLSAEFVARNMTAAQRSSTEARCKKGGYQITT